MPRHPGLVERGRTGHNRAGGQETGQGGSGAPPGPGQGGEERPATPEQQKQFEMFVDKASEMIFDEGQMPQFIQRLSSTQPVEALANTTAMVVKRVQDAADEANANIGPEVTFNAGLEILMLLAEVAKDEGIHEYTPEEIQQATQGAVQIYGQASSALGGQPGPPGEGGQTGHLGPETQGVV